MIKHWVVTKFKSIFSDPSIAEVGSEQYAQDIRNMRINKWGHLTLRPTVKPYLLAQPSAQVVDQLAPAGVELTGLVSSKDRVYWLRSDGKLYMNENTPVETRQITEVQNMEGKLSLAGGFDAFDILTSEGTDRGYIISREFDTAEGVSVKARELGVTLQIPNLFVSADTFTPFEDVDNAESAPHGWLVNQVGHQIGDSHVIIDSGTNDPQENQKFKVAGHGIEYTVTSYTAGTGRLEYTPSAFFDFHDDEAITFEVMSSEVRFIKTFTADDYFYKVALVDSEGREGEPVRRFTRAAFPKLVTELSDFHNNLSNLEQLAALNGMRNRVLISGTIPTGGDINSIHIYRSDKPYPFDTEDDEITYFLVHDAEVQPGASFQHRDQGPQLTDSDLDSDNNIANPNGLPLFEVGITPFRDNTRLPDTAQTITLYNGRLWAAPDRDELRFSDRRDGTPIWHAWPLTNSIRTGYEIIATAAFDRYLIFGGSNSLYRLITTPNRQFFRISNRGPVSPHSFGAVGTRLGYVGIDGFYLTDGLQSQKISAAIDRFFEEGKIIEGFVHTLASGDVLWQARLQEGSLTRTVQFIMSERQEWTRYDNLNGAHVEQLASVNHDGIANTIMVDQDKRAPRTLNWIVDTETEDTIYEVTGSAAVTEQITWQWESQLLDWNEEGHGQKLKTFMELAISAKSTNPIRIDFYFDDAETAEFSETDIELDDMTTTQFYAKRIPVYKKAYGMRFRISGNDAVEIRSLNIKVDILGVGG